MLVGEDSQRLHRFVVVVKRLAHPHQHDVEARGAHVERAGEDANLPDDFSRGEIANQAHLAGEAERARHGAADLRRDAEGVRRRVGNEDRLDVPPILEAQQEFFCAVG